MLKKIRASLKKITAVILPVFIFTMFITIPAKAEETNNNAKTIQLQWYLPGTSPEDFNKVEDKLNTYIKDKLNVTVKFNFLDWVDYLDRKSLLLAAGMNADLLYTAGWANYTNESLNGLYSRLDELINKYAPKTKAILGDKVLNGAKVGGSIYALPVIGDANAVASGIQFRKDLLKKYDIDVSKIKKLSDAATALKTIKGKMPSIMPLVNANESIDYDLVNAEYLINSEKCPGVVSSTGKDNKIYNEFENSETKSFIKVLYDFNKSGLLKKSTSPDYDKEKGKIFALLKSDLNPQTADSTKYEWTQVYLGKPKINQDNATSSMYAIPSNSVYKKEALMVQELINTDTYLTNLLHFGIEGDHYKKVSKNVIDYTEKTKPDNQMYRSYSYWIFGNSYLNYTWKGQNVNIYKDLKAFNDKATNTRSTGFILDTDAFTKEAEACKTVWNKYVPKLINGEYDPQKYLPKFNDELKKAGLPKVLAGKQEQYDNWQKNTANTAYGISLKLDGENLTLAKYPVLENGIVMVHMDSILRSLDSLYKYDTKSKTITASIGKNNLKLTINKNIGQANGKDVKMTAAPKILNNQVYLPLEPTCKALGLEYSWNRDTKTATILTNRQTEQKGNQNGNIENQGYTVSDDEYIFMSLYDEGTFKIKKDGTYKMKLVNQPASYLNVSGDWLYYVNSYYAKDTEKQRLYKIKKDGSGRTKLTDTQVSYAFLVGDWIYYINLSDDNKPYRMGLDGNYKQKISDYSVQSILVDKGWIYFSKSNDTNLYRMRTSGTDTQIITDTGIKYGNSTIKSGDWLYYYGKENATNGIYKVKTDGSDKKLILPSYIANMTFSDGWLYYSDYAGDLYKLNEDLRIKSKIGYNVDDAIGITEDWIYYSQYDSKGESITSENRVKTDGSAKQKFDKTGLITDIYKKDTDTFASKPIVVQTYSNNTTVKTAKEIVKHKDAVVFIKVYDDNGDELASGSGFNIDGSGIVVTNYHVVEGASSIKCTFENTQTYDIDYILNYNEVKDIAILKLKDASNLPVVTLGDSSKVEQADDIYTIGNPLELQNTISDGIVSGIRTKMGIKYIQITAAISPGSSGGALFNAYGDIIGITSMTYSGAQNLNFAVPINEVKELFSTAHIIPIPLFNLVDNSVIEFESNDTMQTSIPCSVDKSLSGSLSSPTDKDYYRLDLSSASKVTIIALTTASLLDKNELSKVQVEILDQSGNIIGVCEESTEDGINILTKAIDFNIGTYYICVKISESAQKSEGQGNYAMVVIKD